MLPGRHAVAERVYPLAIAPFKRRRRSRHARNRTPAPGAVIDRDTSTAPSNSAALLGSSPAHQPDHRGS